MRMVLAQSTLNEGSVNGLIWVEIMSPGLYQFFFYMTTIIETQNEGICFGIMVFHSSNRVSDTCKMNAKVHLRCSGSILSLIPCIYQMYLH